MRFIVDAQLPPALARWLASKGFDAVHVADFQMHSASDSEIWQHAVRTRAAIITKDEDFAQRRGLADAGPTIVWIRLRNTRRQALLSWFDSILPDILIALERGEALIEVT